MPKATKNPNGSESSEGRDSERPAGSLGLRLLTWGLGAAVAVALLALVTGVCIHAYYARDLPGFESLEDYRPLETTRLVSRDGDVTGELFLERRTVVPLEEMPELLVQAFIASEDERFYDHVGLDYLGIARALLRNLRAGAVREGASTITQQVVKTFLLTPERRFSRKFREMILARRLEQNLTKDEILFLYLNQIYFGHGRHGVLEASRYYFGKDLNELDLSEISILAGLPRAPNLYSPRRHPHRALQRRGYVLRRMVEAGMVEQDAAETAADQPLALAPPPTRGAGESYIEEVRRMLDAHLGGELLLGGGLTVEVEMDPEKQEAAEKAVFDNLREIDKRQGWRGPLTHLDPITAKSIDQRFDELAGVQRGRGISGPFAYDLSRLHEWDRDEESIPPLRLAPVEDGLVLGGLVTEVSDEAALVELGDVLALVRLSEMQWARPFNPERATRAPQRVSNVVSSGDVVLVRLGGEAEDGADIVDDEDDDRPVLDASLEQRPLVESALVAIDPETRGVVAMVGGYEAIRGDFNRATQARRQPGSAFKPFVYGAALETADYTAASRVLDAPESFRDRWTGDTWRPRNYDGRFDGEMPIRESLARSKNAVSVRIADRIGVDSIMDFAHRCGITSRLPRFLPLALGSGEVTPMEMVNAYSTLAAGGVREDPVLVRSVRDRDGNEIFRHVAGTEQEVSADVAFILTDMLTSVLEEGTGRSLNRLGRPTAGKTGTTDDRRDAWFVGYTPELVAGVWVGFDEPQPLGRAEYGGRAAGPAWLAFMQSALDGAYSSPFLPPATVRFVRIDPETGLLARPGKSGRYEPFVPGTAPTKSADEMISPLDLFMMDDGEALR